MKARSNAFAVPSQTSDSIVRSDVGNKIESLVYLLVISVYFNPPKIPSRSIDALQRVIIVSREHRRSSGYVYK